MELHHILRSKPVATGRPTSDSHCSRPQPQGGGVGGTHTTGNHRGGGGDTMGWVGGGGGGRGGIAALHHPYIYIYIYIYLCVCCLKGSSQSIAASVADREPWQHSRS